MPIVPRRPQNYAEQTHASPSRLIRYAHRRRYGLVAELCRDLSSRSWVDWGAGDGYLAEVLFTADAGCAPGFVGLYDPAEHMAAAMEQRMAALGLPPGRVGVYRTEAALVADLAGRAVDLVTCLDVLEHMPVPERERFYAFCAAHLNPGGTVLIEAPVELGASIAIKEVGRMVLKGRPTEYGYGELAAATVGRPPADPRRSDPTSTETWVHHHKGFDYRTLRRELDRVFRVERAIASPLRFLPPWAGNQSIMFVCRAR